MLQCIQIIISQCWYKCCSLLPGGFKKNNKNDMVYHTHNELKDLIAAKLTVEQILDILGWETADLVEALSDEIDVYQDDFEEAVS